MTRYRLTFTTDGVTVEALVDTDATTFDPNTLVLLLQAAVLAPKTWTRFAIEVVEP